MSELMNFNLYDSAARVKRPVPHQGARVTIYSCGPTVYDRPTLGNMRTMMFYDWVARSLRWLGYQPERTMNYTDVGHLVSDADEGEDKLAKKAAQTRQTAWQVAEANIKLFDEDAAALNILPPEHLLRATEEIAPMINLIKRLEERGHTYQIEDGLYFDTSTYPGYGSVAHLDLEGQQAGARVAVAAGKKHPADFALWKTSPKDQKRDMEWESPWGVGFPGWHIECSAMAMKTLGETIDLHLGGIDLLPVHHENEAAQSEAATGQPFVRHWTHAEHLLIDGQRMGKSLGNSFTLDVVQAHDFTPLDYRYMAAQTHYRAKMNFTWEGLAAAAQGRQRLAKKVAALSADAQPADGELASRVTAAVADDMNLSAALAAVWQAVNSEQPPSRPFVLDLDRRLFGFSLDDSADIPLPPDLQAKFDEREAARQNKDFATSDRLRDELAAAGVKVEDGPEGSTFTYDKVS
jgi:cysteinyl-tRNA synthetase